MDMTAKYEVGQFYAVRILVGVSEKTLPMLCVKKGERVVRFQYLMRHTDGSLSKHEARRWLGSYGEVETCHIADDWFPRTSKASDKATKPKAWDSVDFTN